MPLSRLSLVRSCFCGLFRHIYSFIRYIDRCAHTRSAAHVSPPPCRNHRAKKPTQESDNTTFSGGEDNGDTRSHLSHDSAPSHAPHPPGQTPSEAGPSRKRPRASDDGSGGEADSGSPTPPLRRHKEGPGSEIELVFRPHPQLVHAQDYNQTR